MTRPITQSESAKYSAIWAFDDYLETSPGAVYVSMFEQIARPSRSETVLDIGAGSGAASVALKSLGLTVRAFDLTRDAWQHDDIPLLTGTVWRDLPRGPFTYGYCCDVMEHIPTEYVGLSIASILEPCIHAFFSISFIPDHFGRYIGQPLHLTVKPFTWWRDTFRELGTVIEARDLIGEGIFYVAR